MLSGRICQEIYLGNLGFGFDPRYNDFIQYFIPVLVIVFIYNESNVIDLLTRRGCNKMADILPTTYSNTFHWTIISEFRLKFHRDVHLEVQLTVSQNWSR